MDHFSLLEKRLSRILGAVAMVRPDWPGPYGCLTIEDDGRGMDEETRNGIFEPFFTIKFQGRGMGMAADPEEAALAVSIAKAYCSEVYTNTAASALEVWGGTGFSWEHDIHLYLKRANANEVTLGDPVYHREQVAQFLAG